MTTKRYALVIPAALSYDEASAAPFVDAKCKADGIVRVGPLKFDQVKDVPFVAFDATEAS